MTDPRFTVLSERLKSLGELKAGWLDGHGEPVSGAALGRAREVLYALLAEHPDIDAYSVFPTPTGEIQAEWDRGPWAIEIVFAADGHGVDGFATNSSTLEDRNATFTQTTSGALAAEIANWFRTITATAPNFTIYLKDSFEWLKSLPDASVDLIVTDPPYSSLEKHRATGTTTRLKVSKGSSNEWFGVIGNDRLPELMRECYRVLRNDRHCYVFTDPETLFFLKPAAEEAGFEFRRIIVWDKVLIGMGYGYRRRTEFILYLLKGKRQVADLGISDLLSCKRVSKGYPTEKPVELIETFIRQSAKIGELVIDPFLGSGSTGVAALRHGCRFMGCDISPKSIATAMPRLSAGDTDTAPRVTSALETLETEEEIERRVRATEPLRECACDGTGECSWCERGVEESARVRQMEEQLHHEYELRKEKEWR